MYAERDFVRQSLTLLVPRLSHRYIPSTHHSHRSYLPHIINLTVSTNPCYHRLAFSFLLLAFRQLRFLFFLTFYVRLSWISATFRAHINTVCPPKSEPLNILQQPQICTDLNKILHTQDDICYKHYKSALTLLKYEFLNNITHKS